MSEAAADRIVMLGVDGGPVLYRGEAEPAIALVVEDATYLIDCGADTARQGDRGRADVRLDPRRLRHPPPPRPHRGAHRPGSRRLDHPADDLDRRAVGPAGHDGDGRRAHRGLPAGRRPVRRRRLPALPRRRPARRDRRRGHHPGQQDDLVTVDAVRVFHGPEVENAYAYRVTVKRTRKVAVFSGDTAAPDRNLIALARDCDVLVHEVQDNERVDELAARLAPEHGPHVRQHLYEAHSNVVDLPEIAQEARAKKLAFCHYTPIPQPPQVYLRKARGAADEVGCDGEIAAPSALDVITL